MNKHLVKIAEQAAEHAVLNASEEILISESDSNKVEIPKEFIEKFADLIVQECAKFTDHAEELYKHFGVEE